MAQTPEERALSARIAASERWAKTRDRNSATAPARAGLRAKFAREVDPDGTLPPAELEERIGQMMRAHMLRMTLAAKRARRHAREARDAATNLDREAKEFDREARELAAGGA